MTNQVDLNGLIDTCTGPGPEAPDIEGRAKLFASFSRRLTGPVRLQLERLLLERVVTQREALATAQKTIQTLGEHVETLTSPPWYPALFVRSTETERGVLAEVDAGGRSLIAADPGIDVTNLQPGDEVFLGTERNVIVALSPSGPYSLGESATVVRWVDDQRLAITEHDHEIIVEASSALGEVDPGDTVRWQRSSMMALEKLPRDDKYCALENITATDASHIGGFDADQIIERFTLSTIHRELAAIYGVAGSRSLLLYGPPGCGKTTTMLAIASEMTRRSGQQCRVFSVKGAELESPYVGMTQSNIKRLFRVANEYPGPAIIFIDEVDAIGRIRGDVNGHHSDKALEAWMAEIEGMEPRSQVAVVAATNRKDLVDAGLKDRLSAMEVHVTRPKRDAAAEIFAIHLPGERPYRPNGSQAADTRAELIELAVARLYSPNADNTVAEIRYRDGTSRTVSAAELISGRLIKQICDNAWDHAFVRAVSGGEAGVCVADMERALDEAIARLRKDLSRVNLDSYLDDVPPQVDIVAVEGVHTPASHPYRIGEGGQT